MNHLGMIKRFIFIWTIYWILYLIQPVYSIYPNIVQAFLLQFAFVFLTSAFFIVGSSTTDAVRAGIYSSTKTFDSDSAVFVIRCGIILSLLGLFLLLYDKIAIQKIDYTRGLAIARQEWRVLGEERDSTTSSIYSAIGYLFGGAYFISLSLALSRLVTLTDRSRVIYLSICATILIFNSAITGGRSSILLAVIFGCFGFFTRNDLSNQKYLFNKSNFNRYFKVLLLMGFGYVLYIFYLRSLASEQLVGAYSLAFLEYLGFAPFNWFAHLAYETEWGGGASLLNLAISYLTHSLATTAAILESANHTGDALFVNFMQIGAKFGIFSQPKDWFLGGRFSSFPGALYFQYGSMGLFVGSALLGIVAGRLARAFSANPNGILLFFLCSIFELILLMSPFLFAGEFLFFPSIVIGGVLTIFLSRLRAK